jgi:hypothetical protein
MKAAPAVRIGLTILGIVLVVGAFAAVTLIGASANPPPLRILVAARDLSVGDRLQPSDYRVVDQVLDAALARLYAQEAEATMYDGAVVVDTIRRGDPLNKVKLATGGASDALTRYALVLTDTDAVVMTLPANPDIIPGKISAGDAVNILFAGGADAGINRLPDPTETPAQLSGGFGLPAAEPSPTPFPAFDEIGVTSVPTLAPTPAIVLPFADLMLEQVPVLDVNHQQLQNPNYGSGNPSEPPYVDGPITSIVVKVPRAYQTLLGFAAVTGKLRFTIGSPLRSAWTVQPEMGVDWRKYVETYRWKELQSLGRGEALTQTLYPSYTPVPPPLLAPIAAPPDAPPPDLPAPAEPMETAEPETR